MRALVAWCVRRRGAVAVLALVLLLLGTWDAGRVPLDVFPEFVPVQVEIQTEAPGLAPEQVEQLVTRPIEAAVNGAPDLAAMRSESIPGLSVVSLNAPTSTRRARASPSGSRPSAARCRPAWAPRHCRRWCRAPWTCSRSAWCRSDSIPTRCAIAPSGC